MATSQWTYGDLATLTADAVRLAEATDATADTTVYCTHCGVAPALSWDDYCAACLNELVEQMAEQWKADMSMSIYR